MANLIRTARERRRWGLREAARNCGIPYSTLSKLENEILSNPTLDTMKALSKGLGIKPAEWFALNQTAEQRK